MMTLEERRLSMRVQVRERLRLTVETRGRWDGFVWRDEGRGFVEIGWFVAFVIVLLSSCSCPSTSIGERVCVCVGVGLRVESGEDGRENLPPLLLLYLGLGLVSVWGREDIRIPRERPSKS